jgi:hypothetical protein
VAVYGSGGDPVPRPTRARLGRESRLPSNCCNRDRARVFKLEVTPGSGWALAPADWDASSLMRSRAAMLALRTPWTSFRRITVPGSGNSTSTSLKLEAILMGSDPAGPGSLAVTCSSS